MLSDDAVTAGDLVLLPRNIRECYICQKRSAARNHSLKLLRPSGPTQEEKHGKTLRRWWAQ